MPKPTFFRFFVSVFVLLALNQVFAEDLILPQELSLSAALAEMEPASEDSISGDTALPEYPATMIYEDPADSYPRPVSFKSFSKDLGGNYKGLFNERNLVPLVAGMALTGAMRTIDHPVGGFFRNRNEITLFSDTGATMGKPYVLAPVIGSLFVAGLKTDNNKFKSFSYALTQGYIMSTSIAFGLKQTVGRERPDGSNSMSFPSGHSADSFMIATVIDQYYGHKAGILAYGVAGLVAASRVKRDVHWLSDITAGATLGYIIGRTVTRNMGGFSLSKKIAVAPVVNPFQKEYGLGVTIRLP